MKRWMKISLATMAGLSTAAVALIGHALHRAAARMARQIELPVQGVAWRDDDQALARGRYLFNSRGCTDCHGVNGGGRVFAENSGQGLKLGGPNITLGPGGVVARYRAEDWERTIRHGVKPDGRPALVMPSEDYNRLTDADLAALVGYIRQMPPVAGHGAILELPLPMRALYGLGLIPDAASRIDHTLPPQRPVPEGVTAEHGRYVANMCIGCHGTTLSGGKIPGAPPDWPAAANITPGQGSAMPLYASAGQFKAMMRGGRRPDGSPISPVMPFSVIKNMSDTDIDALYAFLKTVPPVPAGQR